MQQHLKKESLKKESIWTVAFESKVNETTLQAAVRSEVKYAKNTFRDWVGVFSSVMFQF